MTRRPGRRLSHPRMIGPQLASGRQLRQTTTLLVSRRSVSLAWVRRAARPAGRRRHTGLLRHLSRDLGVYLDGELYVTGRIADLVIIDGGCRRTSAITSAQCASSAAATGGRSLTCGASTTAARTRSAARGARPRSGASQISPPAGHRRIRRGSARYDVARQGNPRAPRTPTAEAVAAQSLTRECSPMASINRAPRQRCDSESLSATAEAESNRVSDWRTG